MEETLRSGPGLVESLWRHRFVIVAISVLGVGLGVLVALQQPVRYEATARLYLDDPSAAPIDEARQTIDVQRYVPQQSARLQSRPVLVAAAERLGDDRDVDSLRRAVNVVADVELLLLDVSARSGDPTRAAAIANAVSEAYIDFVATERRRSAEEATSELQVQIDALSATVEELNDALQADPDNVATASLVRSLTDRLIALEAQRQGVLLQANIRGSGVELLELAEVSEEPVSAEPRVFGAGVGMLAFLGASLWAYWRAARTRRVQSRSDPETVLGIPALGEIPRYERQSSDALANILRLDHGTVEAFEFVLAGVEFGLAEIGGTTVLITSPAPGDGKTSTSLNLAVAAARNQRRTMLVDGDVRARGLTRLLRAEQQPGLTDLIALDVDPLQVGRRYRFTEHAMVPVVTAGQGHGDATSMMRSPAFRRALEVLGQDVDLLLVDTPPLLAVADATIIAGSVDAIVLVIDHGTLVSQLERVRERLNFVSTPVLGYIYNRGAPAGGYGYAYGPEEPRRSTWRQALRRRRSPEPGNAGGPSDERETAEAV